MADAAHKAADAAVTAFQDEIAYEYRKAEKTARARLEAHLKRYEKRDKELQKAVKLGTMGEADYKAWRKREMLTGKRWSATVEQMAAGYTSANKTAVSILQGKLPAVAAENANYAAYQVDSAIRMDTAFALQDAGTVATLLKDADAYFPKPTVHAGKDKAWNRRMLKSAVTQGVLLGESIPKITSRVSRITGSNFAQATRLARTSVTAAENAGRTASYDRAQKLGIKLEQEWLSTLDGRTRHSHRLLDGERVKVGERFSNGCRYPGDPEAPYAETANCRCTLVAAVEGVDTSDAQRWSKLPEGMSYEEWKELKKRGEEDATQAAEQRMTLKELRDEVYDLATCVYYEDEDAGEEYGLEDYIDDPEYVKRRLRKGPPGALEEFEGSVQAYADMYAQLLEREMEISRAEFDVDYELYDDFNVNRTGFFVDGAAADTALDAAATQILRTLSRDEKISITQYTGDWYGALNETLRESDGKSSSEFVGLLMNHLTRSLNKAKLEKDVKVARYISTETLGRLFGLSEETLAKRSFSMTEDFASGVAKELENSSATEKGFMSTAAIKNISGFKNSKVRLEIFAPKGTNAAYINSISKYRNVEYEVLFQQGTELTVRDVRLDGEYLVVGCYALTDPSKVKVWKGSGK